MPEDVHEALGRLFGFDDFRPGQEDVVRAAVGGRDTLALMPTGSGKSLTYQLAAMLRPQPTLVLSPLIALMKDQIDKLPPAVSEQATLVNSSLEPEEAAARLAGVARGRYRLLYAAPERLRQRGFLEALRACGIGLVVVDEVHCVSAWGHDFRPDYFFIRRALEELGSPPMLGMTATASPETEAEIAAALGRSFDVVRTSVVRPNHRYDVERAEREEERLRVLLRRLHAVDGAPAIVYARSRRSCERLALVLRQHGFRALHYHAGLERDERTQAQDAFLSGRAQVVCATTAFGMGIDKPDVRLVLLYNLPESLETYVQMVGRAGRDGRPSDTVLLLGDGDARSLRRFALGDVPRPDELLGLLEVLRRRPLVTPEELAAGLRDELDPRVLVGMLEQAGLLVRGFDAGRAFEVTLTDAASEPGGEVGALLRRLAAVAERRVRRLIGFAESQRCRHAQVAEHFGEQLEPPCGACDVCAPAAAAASRAGPDAVPARPLPDDIGAAVVGAVGDLRWPLGRAGLAAMLSGSVAAPPSARRSPHYGLLGAARPADVKRWIGLLEATGALEQFESEDGFRLLRAVPGAEVPRIVAPGAARPGDTPRPGPAGDATNGSRSNGDGPDDELFERLRAWRLERSRADEVPAYVVLHDTTLRELAAAQPRTATELACVSGFGPTKIERYGDDVLAVISAAQG